jgi:orotidine-5'-phosphate decarboxylase
LPCRKNDWRSKITLSLSARKRRLSSEAARSRLILALDVGGDVEGALSWVGRLKGRVGMFKVGKEAFTSFARR